MDKTQAQLDAEANKANEPTPREKEMQGLLNQQAEQLKTLQGQAQKVLAQNQQLKEQQESASQKKLDEELNLKNLLKDKTDKSNTNVGVEDLTNAELLSIIGEAVESNSTANFENGIKKYVKDFGTEIVGLKDQIGGLQQTIIKQAAHTSVQNLRAKHTDVDSYRDDINAILERNTGLDLEDAYILAKAKKHKGLPAKEKVDSERPNGALTNHTTNQAQQTNRKTERPSGVKGFRSILEAGVNKVIDGRANGIYNDEE